MSDKLELSRGTICAICGKGGKKRLFTIRKSWIDAGGWGEIPKCAIVHITCDCKETDKINSGVLSVSKLWRKVAKNDV